jgi:transposase
MASLYKQTVNGHDYYYIREMARVNGKPKAVNTFYLGSVANIMQMAASSKQNGLVKVKSDSFGALWLANQIEEEFGMAELVDGIIQDKKEDAPSVGEYFLYAVLNRMIDAVSKDSLPDWYAKTAVQVIRPVKLNLLDSRNFWRAWEKVDEKKLRTIAEAFFDKVGRFLRSGSECVLFDTTNFYTFMDSATESELARRGKNKQGRDWLRQIGLALLVDRGSRLPLYYGDHLLLNILATSS